MERKLLQGGIILKAINHKRLGNLTGSEIRIMSIECEKVQGINLSQGICDMPLPPVLSSSVQKAVESGINHYTRYDGLLELRQSISRRLKTYNHIETDPETDIIVTCGSTGAFYSACLGLLSPGDEVILFEPFYGYHEYTLMALDLVPLYVKLNPPSWEFNLTEIESRITKNTKAIMINTPANPSGKIFSREELQQLSQLCIQHNLLIFTDEIYEYIIYDGRPHISPGALKEIKDRVITISGYSKTFSITGWRIGYCACQKELAGRIGCASDLVYACAPAPLQAAVSEALDTLTESFYHSLAETFEAKRSMVCDALKDAGLTPYIPQGAYYILADAGKLPGNTSKEKAMYLLDKTGIAVVPGSSFFHDTGGEKLIRLCFAKEDTILEQACERLQKIKTI